MELRHLRYFIAVAEEKNFTRAALRLGIGQPPLSQQIKDLETEVGARLFRRVPYGAELTEAGKVFLERVRDIPQQAQEAARAARRAARGETGRLNLGFTGTAALNPIVPACIREFRKAFPEVEIRLEESNSLGLLNGLMEYRLDVAFVRPNKSNPSELDYFELATERLVAVVPADHPAAMEGSTVALSRFQNDFLLLPPPDVGFGLRDVVLATCKNAGYEPRMGQLAPHIASILSLVAAEQGVALVPESMRQLQIKGVEFLDLQGSDETIGLSVALQRIRPAEPAKNFVRLAQKISRDLSAKPTGRPGRRR